MVFREEWKGDQSLPTECKRVIKRGREVKDFGKIMWFSGENGGMINNCQQSIKQEHRELTVN